MHALRLRVEGGHDGVTTCGEEALGRELAERATDHLGEPHVVVTHESCAASRAAVPHAGILARTRCPP
jgi:hypothetical protein